EPDALRLRQLPHGVVREEARDVLLRAVEDHTDVVVPRRPRIVHEGAYRRLVDGPDGVPQPVERRAQRPAPLLVPARMAAGVAAAVAPPPLDAVLARPCGILD